MINEGQHESFSEWFPSAFGDWVSVIGILILVGIILTYLVMATRYGPGSAFERLLKMLGRSVEDVYSTSPRRVFALSRLAVKESMRSLVAVALVVFILILMFAGWFLPRGLDDPAPLYINFVLTATTFLVLVLALLLSVFSLPADIKKKTIYTIVTKPVRPGEILLGRILGFSFIGTVMLFAMSISSYLFLVRVLDHAHEVVVDEVRDLDLPPVGGHFDENTIVTSGRLTTAEGHYHPFTINAAGDGMSESAAGHFHVLRNNARSTIRYAKVEPGDATKIHLFFSQPIDPVAGEKTDSYQLSGDNLSITSATVAPDNRHVTLVASGKIDIGETRVEVSGEVKSRLGVPLEDREVVIGEQDVPHTIDQYTVDDPLGQFRARVAVEGTLSFRSRTGAVRNRGISTGKEWSYRSFIFGASSAAAIWTFSDVTHERFGDVLPLELTLRAFRTRTGRVDRGVVAHVFVQNPETGLRSKPRTFTVRDGQIDQQYLPRKLKSRDESNKTIDVDLYDDLTHDGKIEVWVQCIENEQYLGMARADAYLLAKEASFGWNFTKASITTWFQMILVIVLGVVFSSFLSGPIAMIGTLMTVLLGFFTEYISKIATNTLHGGDQEYASGPIESFYRMIMQKNVVSKLDPGPGTTVIKMLDGIIQNVLQSIVEVLPNFREISRTDFVAQGFSIPSGDMLQTGLTMVGFVVPAILAGYILMKSREVAL